jgi:hypothetical protein
MVRAGVRNTLRVAGRIDPITGIREAKYFMDVLDGPGQGDEGSSPWSGMSGAGVFHDRFLVGVVNATVPGWPNGRLTVTPVRRLLLAEGFSAAVAEVVGTVPRIESADQSRLFETAPPPRLAPSYLLDPRAEVVPFVGMHDEIGRLLDWCVSAEPVDVAVVHGPGGMGKTRLGVELLRRLTEREANLWTAAFLAEIALEQAVDYRSLGANARPLMVVIDYAETRLAQVDRVLDVLRHKASTEERVRVLLLARSTRGWWQDRCLTYQGSGVEFGPDIELDAESARRGPASLGGRDTAMRAFRRRIALLRNSPGTVGDPPVGDPGADRILSGGRRDDDIAGMSGGNAVTVHMEALAAVLDTLDGAQTPRVPTAQGLLGHEFRYWKRSVGAVGLDLFSPRRIGMFWRRMVAVQRMLGAVDRAQALSAMLAAFDIEDPDFPVPVPTDSETLRRLDEVLTGLYPSRNSTIHWGALGPDMMVAELIAFAEKGTGGGFLAQLLPNDKLSDGQRRHALTVIARSASTHPGLTDGVARAVLADPDSILASAVAVTDELGESDALVWLDGLRATLGRMPDAADLVRRVAAAADHIRRDPEKPIAPTSAAADPSDRPLGEEPTAAVAPLDFNSLVGYPNDGEALDALDRSLRTLERNATRSGGPSLPEVVSATVGPRHDIELHPVAPAVAIAPFVSEDPHIVWRCSPLANLLSPAEVATERAPYPALAPFGRTLEEGTRFLNLQTLRTIHVAGATDSVRELFRVAAEGLSGPIADELDLHLVGDIDPPTTTRPTTRVHHHDSLGRALDAIAAVAADHATGADRPLHVVFSLHRLTPASGSRIDALLDAESPVSLALVARAPEHPDECPLADLPLVIKGTGEEP